MDDLFVLVGEFVVQSTQNTHTHTKTHIKSLKGKIYVIEVKTFKKYEIYMLGN